MSDVEAARTVEQAPRQLAGAPVDRDALWYDCETEGRDEGGGHVVAVGAAVLVLAAIGVAAWYLA